MATPTPQELEQVAIVRDKLQDVLKDAPRSDFFILRFIREKDGNLDLAEKMIRAEITWRKENEIDKLALLPLNEFCRTNFPLQIAGRDRAGQPLVTVSMGSWDLAKASSDDAKFTQFKTYCIQVYERIMAEIRKCDAERNPNSPKITQYTVIYDWTNFSFKPLFSVSVDKHMAQIIAIVEQNYPQTLGNCLYVNCPSAISTLLSIAKPVMSSHTFSKIQHFNNDRSKWQPVVLGLVDPSQLTPQFGGTKVVVAVVG